MSRKIAQHAQNKIFLSLSRPLKKGTVKSPVRRPGTEAPTKNINVSIWNSTPLKYVKLAEAKVRRL